MRASISALGHWLAMRPRVWVSPGSRPPPEEWEKAYAIDEELSGLDPTWIAIMDDLLVTGCRFRAMSNILKRRFPFARVTGI
jgi:hypothetical protein